MSESASNNGSATNDPHGGRRDVRTRKTSLKTVEPADENESLTEGDSARDAEGEGPIHRRLIARVVAASRRAAAAGAPHSRIHDSTARRTPEPLPATSRPRRGSGGQGQHGHQFGGNRSNGNMGGMRGGRPGGGGGGMTQPARPERRRTKALEVSGLCPYPAKLV